MKPGVFYEGIGALEEFLSGTRIIDDFVLLKFQCPYADFGLQSSPWVTIPSLPESALKEFPLWTSQVTPEYATLGISANQDLSVPFSKLYSATALYPVEPEEIAPVLRRIFSFNTQQTSPS